MRLGAGGASSVTIAGAVVPIIPAAVEGDKGVLASFHP